MSSRYDNRKRLEISCLACQGAGSATYGDGRGRCRDCRGRGSVKIVNPFYVPPGSVPTWFQLGGGEGWAREIRRMLALSPHRCTPAPLRKRFRLVCRRLEPWRIRSHVHCSSRAIAAILPLLEDAHRNGGRFLDSRATNNPETGWTRAELGELLVEARNRAALWELGRLAPREKGPRFDLARIPIEALERLIQRHPNLELVEAMRAERNRRGNFL